MTKKVLKHNLILLNALRTAVLFFAAFFVYEILINLEKLWNLKNPENSEIHFYKRKIMKFIIVFVLDAMILYALFFLTGEHF